MQKSVFRGHLCALFTIAIWGTTFISTKVLLADFTPAEILLCRFVLGFVALCAVYPRRLRGATLRRELMFAGAGLSGVTLYYLLENVGLTYTLASNAGVITSVAPFFTAILAHFTLRGEGLNRQFLLGFVAAMGGILLIGLNGSVVLRLNPLGDLLILLAAVAWAVYSICIRKISAWGLHTIQATRRIFLYGILFMLPVVCAMDFRLDPALFARPVNLLNMLYLGLGASAACFVTWNYAIGQLGAMKASAYIYGVPVITIAVSVPVLSEPVTWMGLAGAALTLAGLFLSERPLRRKTP